MKLFKLCSVLCVTLCIVGLGINLHVSASTGLEEKNRKVEEYVQQVQEHNEEVSLLNLEDIPATITLENNITYTQLSEYIADVPATLSNEKSVEFPHSLAWTIEELH